MTKKIYTQTPIERFISWMGSVQSLIVHTVVFLASFGLSVFGIISWERMLLVLTTLLSLEAIYMAIFIQMTVNRNTESLREVEEDIDEIQEDVEDLGEDLEEIQEDLGEIQEDVEELGTDLEEIQEDLGEIQEDVEEINEEDAEEEKRDKEQSDKFEQIARDMQRLLTDIEALKGKK